ncbi:unnamed protein product [Urochloa decumbens]|uniref:MATH domain-containing protein n=1 Tax=Urochloa decumbens TaxID=240449 RepID=A0ABC9H066_9POAL
MAAYSNAAAAAAGSGLTISTETATGYHVLKIKRYSQSIGTHGIGESINSSVFRVGGHRWYIAYYPAGYSEDAADCVSFDLFLDKPGRKAVKARFVFTLLDQAGEPVPEYTMSSGMETFSGAIPSFGFERFIDTADLEEYLKDDSFSVRCDVTVFDESPEQVAAMALASRKATVPLECILVFVFAALFAYWIQNMC